MSLATKLEFNTNILLSQKTDIDRGGYNIYGSPVTISARVENKAERVVTNENEEFISNKIIHISSAGTPQLNSKIELADGSTPEILRIESCKNEYNKIFKYKVWTR